MTFHPQHNKLSSRLFPKARELSKIFEKKIKKGGGTPNIQIWNFCYSTLQLGTIKEPSDRTEAIPVPCLSLALPLTSLLILTHSPTSSWFHYIGLDCLFKLLQDEKLSLFIERRTPPWSSIISQGERWRRNRKHSALSQRRFPSTNLLSYALFMRATKDLEQLLTDRLDGTSPPVLHSLPFLCHSLIKKDPAVEATESERNFLESPNHKRNSIGDEKRREMSQGVKHYLVGN